MTPNDLVAVADGLAQMTTEAAWRRSVSTAYYAVFHLLCSESVRAMGVTDPVAAAAMQRAFDHKTMVDACKPFANAAFKSEGKTPKSFKGVALNVSTELEAVAEAFGTLQALRHIADYDLRAPVHQSDAQDAVQLAQQLFVEWSKVPSDATRQAFLVYLALHSSLNKR
jgi:hypothetical protein